MSPVFAIIDAPIIVIILGVAVLLFGADKIPKLARSMGEAKKEFESASRTPNAQAPPPTGAADPAGAGSQPAPPPQSPAAPQ